VCQAVSGSQKSVRPTAKPMKPGTAAAVVSHSCGPWLIAFSAAKDDAADRVAPACLCRRYDFFAIFAAIESFNLPHVGFDACVPAIP
jgi:hypothetical protein